ncbi:hypothetical protein MNBD_PLANCTO02-926 [hydrothermal vent metagenome]|uniref:Response regulatory domain-containing protein n=1 Tax=hydrothermal vent metagenome TaxID=652676 RepID=A0A3B1D6D7_9ZZZZ
MSEVPKRVLLVDDDEEILAVTKMVLESNGYEVITAQDGCEGLTCIERDRPDVVVLDLVMPRRNGFSLLERLHVDASHPARSPRIIMTTGNDEQRHRDSAKSRGVDIFLPKPYDVDELIECIEKLLSEK